MNDTADLKNFHYFRCKNEVFKVYTNTLQEAVVKRMKQQIENEEVVVRLIDYNRCVKQENKQQMMKNQDSLKRKRVRSHLLQLFDSPIDDIDCDPLPDKKRKCLNKTKDKQLCYAIVDILDDLILEDAKLEPKLEHFDNYQNEIVTINTEIGNLIDYKCVKKLNKPIILRAITNFQQIKNEPIEGNENIPEHIQNNDNNIDNSNDNETVMNQRLPLETFTTTETTIDNRIVDNNDNNNSTNDRISDYILIIYEYLRDYLRILHQMNILNRLFSQIFKQYACNLTKELVQMLNQCRYILGEEFMKCIVSFQIQQLQTFNIDDIFNKLLELLKKDNINIEKYKFFCHVYQFLKPHQESIYNMNLLKIIYDEIEKFLKESDDERMRQLQLRTNQPTQGLVNQQQQNNGVNEPRYVAQPLLNHQQQTTPVTRQQQQQENVVNEPRYVAQQQQGSVLNQERPATQISLSHQQLQQQQQQSNSIKQQRTPAQTSLNQQQQQDSVLHQTTSMTRQQQQQQQENVVNQPQYVTQSLLNHHQEQGGVLHQARSVTRQQQQQQQDNVVNQPQYVTQSLLNQQQQKQQEEGLATRISLNHQQLQQQHNLINQQRSVAQTTLNPQQQQQQHQKQQENDQRSVILIPLNHQNLQYQQQQKQQENQQKIIIETFLSYQHYQQVLLQQQQQQQNNPLNQQRSIAQASLNHQQQENVLNEQRSVARTSLSHQLQQDNGLNEQQQENGLNLQKSTATRTTLSHQQILQQQNALNQQRSVIQAPLSHQKQQQYRKENPLNLQKSTTETSLLKQQLNQPKFLKAFLNFHQLTQKQQYQQQVSGLHQTRSVTRQQQASKSKQKNSSVIQQTTKCFQQQTHKKSIYEKQQYSSNCFVASLSNRQLKPQSKQPQPQVETPIVFTQIQLTMLEEQIKDYRKLFQFKQLNNQQLQNNTTQVQQNQPSVIVTSSSTHQFVNNLGNIIRKVDGNIANSNHNRSIKQINGQLSKQQFNNSTISRNSALSKVQLASTSVLSSQQQREQPTVLPELSPISTTTTTVLSSTTPIREVVKNSTTTTTSTSSELCRENLRISPLPTTSLSDSLFSSIPPPIPTTENTTTCLPTLTLILTTPTTTTLTSSKSTPIVTTKIEPELTTIELIENTTIEDKDDAIVETVSSSIQTKQESESSSSIILPSSVENNEETIELLKSSIQTKQETRSRSSSPILPLLETIGNEEPIKLLQSFEIKTEDCKEIDNLNYEYDGFGDDTTIKLNDYINIDDLYKHIKIEKKDIGGVSPSDSGLGSPFDMEMADLLHSNNDDVQIISDCISGQNEESSICLCGKKALYLCACRYSMYCSETCRLIDWKCHKSLCLRTIR